MTAIHESLARLLGALELERLGPGRYRAGHPNERAGHLFGGQVLAQSLMAAHTEHGAGLAHSMHAYFLKRGSAAEPIAFEVVELRRSRTFHTLQIVASQSVGPILHATVSYHDAEPGPDHQIPMDDVGEPGGEAYEEALLEVMTPGGLMGDGPFELPVEIRGVGHFGLFKSETLPPYSRCWMRTRGPLPEDPQLHQCLFAYGSDYAIFAPVIQPHPRPVTAYQSASLDHAIWFHRPLRMDDWLLFELDSPVASAARGVGRGLLYTRDGRLVASCVQEGLLRPL